MTAASREAGPAVGAIAWFTGLPASGKSTLARQLQARLATAIRLDSDELRDVLGSHSYAPADRDRFYAALTALAAVLAEQGAVVLVSATAPRREYRARARAAAPRDPWGRARFIEVWVNTPLAVCETRDPKGLYAAARRDAANQLPGMGIPYETPLEPEVVVDLSQSGAAAAAIDRVLDLLPRSSCQ